ncbi:MAG: hypothetical protein J7647_15600 [Cyanobacteria bacterium SBLK]|nr:hypothetical protein [Cyanobacteria bacterium SBLK]
MNTLAIAWCFPDWSVNLSGDEIGYAIGLPFVLISQFSKSVLRRRLRCSKLFRRASRNPVQVAIDMSGLALPVQPKLLHFGLQHP